MRPAKIPAFNEKNFVIDKVSQATLTVKGTGQQIPYTEVDGHFNPTQTQATLPPGVGSSPTTVRHGVKWLFPARRFGTTDSSMPCTRSH